MAEKILVYCDGSITGSHWAKKADKNSPAVGWSGWVVCQEDRTVIHHHSLHLGSLPEMSANVAEYMAVRSALHWLSKEFVTRPIHVHSDSQLVMRQLSGVYQVHNELLQKMHAHVSKLASLFPRVTYTWIPREQNTYADHMSKALQNGGAIPPVPAGTLEEALAAIKK